MHAPGESESGRIIRASDLSDQQFFELLEQQKAVQNQGGMSRRQFFEITGMTTAGLALAQALPDEAIGKERISAAQKEREEYEKSWAIATIQGGEEKWKKVKKASLRAKGLFSDDRDSFEAEKRWLMEKVLPGNYQLAYPNRLDKSSLWKKGGRQEKGSGTVLEVGSLGIMKDGKLVPANNGRAEWIAIGTNKHAEHSVLNPYGICESYTPTTDRMDLIREVESQTRKAGDEYMDEA